MSRTKIYGVIFGFVIVLAILAGNESHAYPLRVHEGHNELVMLSSIPEDTYTLTDSSESHHDHEDQTHLKESHGHSRNLNVILSKPEGIRIIENMEQNRVRSHSQEQTASFGTRTSINQEGSAETIHQTRHTEIHQTISQRK